MSNFFDDAKLLLKEFDKQTVEFACEMFTSEKADFIASKQFHTLLRDEYFFRRLARLYGGPYNDGEKKRIVEILAGFATVDALNEIMNIYLAANDRGKSDIKTALLKYGYGYIDQFNRLKIIYKTNQEVLSLIDGIVKKSGYYEDLKQLLESPSEKIILYVLKQYHKYCDAGIIDILKKYKSDSNWMVRFNVLQVVKKLETPEALGLMLGFLADDNIKVREEAKTFIISNYNMFAERIIGHIDDPRSIGDLGYFQGVLEIFEYHPDFTRIMNIIRIMIEFPEGVSLKARTVLFNIMKTKLKTRELALDRDCERYQLMRLVVVELCKWNTEQAAKLVIKLIENFGYLYIDILCAEYFNSDSEDVKNFINKIFRDRQYFLKERNILLELCQTLDAEGLEKFIKFLALNKVKEIIISFAKILDALGHKKTVELYRFFTENDLNAKGFGQKYKAAIKTWNAATKIECIEALSYLKDFELLDLMMQDWKTYQREVKLTALKAVEANFLTGEALKFLNHVFIHDEEYDLKEAALQQIAKIESTESTEIILKAFGSPRKVIAEIAAKILVEKGRGRLMSQINVLPDNLKEELGNILIKNDSKFIDEIEKQIASTDPRIRNQIIKLLTYLSRDERSKILNLLKKFIKNPDPHIRADFTKLMEIIGGAEIVEYLIPLINDENPRVKANAIEVIASLNLREISNILLPLTSHVNNRVRANAIIALYKLGNPNVIVGLSEMLRSSDKWMRASATYALGEISDPRVLPLLYTVLNDADLDVIKNAFKVIKKVGDAESIKYLTKFLNHDNKAIKLAASEAINHLRKETAGKN